MDDAQIMRRSSQNCDADLKNNGSKVEKTKATQGSESNFGLL